MSSMNDELKPNKTSEQEEIARYAKEKNLQLEEAKRYYNTLKKLNRDANVEEQRRAIESSKLSAAEKERRFAEVNRVIKSNEERALKATMEYRRNLMEMSTEEEKKRHFEAAQARERKYRAEAKKTALQRIEEAQRSGKSEAEIAEACAKIRKKYHDEEMESIKREKAAKKENEKEAQKKKDKELRIKMGKIDQKYDPLYDKREATKGEKVLTRSLEAFKALGGGHAGAIDKAVKVAEIKSNAAEEKKDAIKAKMDELDPSDPSDYRKLEQLQQQFIQANKEAVMAANELSAAKTAQAISNAIASAYKSAFTQAETMLTSYQAHIDARLQGSEKSYDDISNKITSLLSTSPFVKSVDVMNKLKDATDQGIVYNVEQRAFLGVIADKIANTFDAFDANLLRLIRLQQADTTAARLGMEASLTKLFNAKFNDTSYLTQVADTVAGALLEASSIMEKNQATEFEYIVQKWLGSLSSLGMDGGTINKIAQGINYIATGDVTSLANNTSLQTLFALSASNANLEYSKLLLNGLDADTTNNLLRSMVEYLKTIAEESENNVVRSAYSDIFDLSVADMRAISNLTSTEIDDIHGYVMTYENMQGELNTQMSQLSSRVNLASMLSNLYQNVVYGVASDMVNNPATFGMQKMLDFMVSEGVNFNIPFINAMGFGLDLNASVTDLMRIAVGASQATMLVANLLKGLGSGGGTNLDSWDYSEYNTRGNTFNFGKYSTLGGTSSSTYVSNSSTSDMQTSSISSATDDAEETGKITGKNQEVPEKTTDDFYAAIIGDDATEYVKIKDESIMGAYDAQGNFLRVQDSRFYFDGELLKVIDVGASESANEFINIKSNVLDGVYAPETQALRVVISNSGNANTTLAVCDTQLSQISSKLSEIYTLMSTPSEAETTVKLADNSVVDIKKETLVQALRDVLYDGNDDSISTLLDIIEGGNMVVKSVTDTVAVKTPVGEKLQVSNLTW